MRLKLFFLLILIVSLPVSLSAYTRIFYEDCEDTSYAEHFMEDYFGTNYLEYWNYLKGAMSQDSTYKKRGTYSMKYDSFNCISTMSCNPHTVVGDGAMNYGNLSNFDLTSYNSRYWYFRWYQRWETGIDRGGLHVKMLYINYQSDPDFTWFLIWNGYTGWQVTLKDFATYSLVSNEYFGVADTDDEAWHKIEVIIDVGTTGGANGSYQVKLDGVSEINQTGLTFNSTINANPISYLTGWPSNLSGTPGTGTAWTWLDDLEIYTLDNTSDIPPELDADATATVTGVSINQ